MTVEVPRRMYEIRIGTYLGKYYAWVRRKTPNDFGDYITPEGCTCGTCLNECWYDNFDDLTDAIRNFLDAPDNSDYEAEAEQAA